MIEVETGHPAPKNWKRRQKSKSESQTERLAEIIGGLKKETDKGGRKLYFQATLADQKPTEINEYRNCNLLPDIARKNRKPVKNLLQYYLEREEKRNHRRPPGQKYSCRMVVFNAGKTCHAEEIGDRIKKVCKKIQNASFMLKTANLPVEILARNIEIAGFTRPEKDLFGNATGKLKKNTDTEGKTLFHVHAHVLIEMRKKLDGKEWKSYLKKIGATKGRRTTQGRGIDAGQMRGADEITKYLTKTEGLELLAPAELKEIFRQTFRRKVLHLSGPALELCHELKKAGKTPLPPRNGQGWKIQPIAPRNPRRKAAKTEPPTKPQAITTTRPAPTACPLSIPGLLFRARPEDAQDFLRNWMFTRQGQATTRAQNAGLVARGIAPESLENAAALCLVHTYDDSALDKDKPEIDPADLDLPSLFPDLF